MPNPVQDKKILPMPKLNEVVTFCDQASRRAEITDFPGAWNGLQFANQGTVNKIGAAVDAGLHPFRQAAALAIDFLIVHHGLFWGDQQPITENTYEKFAVLYKCNCAVYSSHLPLDCHPELGNNAILARKLGLSADAWFLEHEGNPIAALAKSSYTRDELKGRLKALFPDTFTAIEFGSTQPDRVAILTGSGRSALTELKQQDCDTLITGELRQQHFNYAQEHKLNLYPCGHYATETFGVKALAQLTAEHFGLDWEFIDTGCPL